jgi:succinate dehydrogenase/fumarate reductase iron-sulfur protein
VSGEAAMNVKCAIYRCNPASDSEGRYETYLLSADPTETVLDILLRIYRDFQPALSFRFSCGVVKCGECAVSVNGTPCLACEKAIEPEMKIDPLPHLPLIKDLVIDRRKAFEHIFKVLPELSRKLEISQRWQSPEPEIADKYVQLTRCFECLMCQSACPVFADIPEKFVGPLGLLWLAQMSLDPKSEAVARQHAGSALEFCARCGACSDVCPCSEKILDLAMETLEKG